MASGNEADVDMSEYLDWMLQDPQVRVLAALFEGLVRPKAFIEVCRRASARNVPVVVCRIGRSVAGQRAARPVSRRAACTGQFDPAAPALRSGR